MCFFFHKSKKERQAVEALKNDKEIVIVRADKGNTTVIMNTTDYEQKASEILNNSPFKKTRKDPSKRTARILNSKLNNLRKKKAHQ